MKILKGFYLQCKLSLSWQILVEWISMGYFDYAYYSNYITRWTQKCCTRTSTKLLLSFRDFISSTVFYITSGNFVLTWLPTEYYTKLFTITFKIWFNCRHSVVIRSLMNVNINTLNYSSCTKNIVHVILA